MGRRLHRVRTDQPGFRHHAPRLVALLGRRRRREPGAHVHSRASPRLAGGHRAAPRRCDGTPERVALAGHRGFADLQRDVSRRDGAEGDGLRRHPSGAAGLGGRGGARQGCRFRHRLCVRRSQLPAAAIPLPEAEPEKRRLRRDAREPCPALARDSRARARPSGPTAPSPPASPSRPSALGAYRPPRVSALCRWPITWSISGTSPSARWRGWRGSTRRPPVSSPRATSSVGHTRSAR